MVKNSLAERFPEVARQWHPALNGDLTPKDVGIWRSGKRWWRHYDRKTKKYHQWETTIEHRLLSVGDGCAICSGHQVQIGINDLCTTYPKVAREWHPVKNNLLTPEQVTQGSHKKIWWLCPKCKHEWKMTPSDRTGSGRQGCPVEAGKVVKIGYNDLATLRPSLAKEWHPTKNGKLSPKNFTAVSGEKAWWFCRVCDYSWKTKISSRSGGSKCPVEAGKVVKLGINDFKTKYPILAAEWFQPKNGHLKPSQVTVGSHAKIWWKCGTCQHLWTATVNDRSNRRGCPKCAKYGFDLTTSAYLYIISGLIGKTKVMQFGITKNPKRRLREHNASGFSLIPCLLIPFASGIDAKDNERKIISLMKEHEIPNCKMREILFKGSTESFIVEDATEDFVEDFNLFLYKISTVY